MRIKLDENLPQALVPILQRLGHEVSTVESEHLTRHADEDIWAAAQQGSDF